MAQGSMFVHSIIMREFLMMTSLILLDTLTIKMEKSIKETLMMVKKMERGFTLGLMVPIMKDFIRMIWSMVKENLNLKMNLIGKENGFMGKNKDLEHYLLGTKSMLPNGWMECQQIIQTKATLAIWQAEFQLIDDFIISNIFRILMRKKFGNCWMDWKISLFLQFTLKVSLSF